MKWNGYIDCIGVVSESSENKHVNFAKLFMPHELGEQLVKKLTGSVLMSKHFGKVIGKIDKCWGENERVYMSGELHEKTWVDDKGLSYEIHGTRKWLPDGTLMHTSIVYANVAITVNSKGAYPSSGIEVTG